MSRLAADRHPFSMRIRLTLWVALIIMLVLWVKSLVLWLYVRQSIYAMFLQTHGQLSSQIADQIAPDVPGLTAQGLRDYEHKAVRSAEFETVYLDVYAVNGEHAIEGIDPLIVASDLPLTEAAVSIDTLLVDDDVLFENMRGTERYADVSMAQLVSFMGNDGKPYVLLCATTSRFAESRIDLVGNVLLITAAATPLIGFIAGWFISGFAVSPIRRAQKMIEQMNPEKLNKSFEADPHTTEEADLAGQVEDARDKIWQAFESQERFIANVSHEIKTPISVMLAQAQTLNLEGQPAEIKHFASSVQDEMKRLGDMVESFLTLTRLEDGQDRTRGKRVVVNDFVMNSADHCASMARQYGVQLRPTLMLEDDGPDAAVMGEPDLLVTMLDNLIRNAIRFSHCGESIDIVVEGGKGQVSIFVRDHGPGIPEDRIENIFDRFSQSENGRRKGRGHGLGLTIAKGIVELHRGSITARNTQTGCEFHIVLPTIKQE